MTTDFSNNSYVQDGKLYIVPTLTSAAIGKDAIFDGAHYNITGCTNTNSCVVSPLHLSPLLISNCF